MAFEKKPNNGTLFTNKDKQTEEHPDYKGYLLIDRALLTELMRASQGNIELEISSWIKPTKAGATNINLACKKMYKKPADDQPQYKAGTPPQYYAPETIHEPTPNQSPQPPIAPPTPADAQKYLDRLKTRIASIASYPDFEKLYESIHSPKIWEVFKSIPAIAQEANALLSAKKTELILAIAPVDLSAIISALNVECDRLNLPKKEHCIARWNRTRAELTPQELEIYLQELREAKPIAIDEDCF